MSISNAVGPNRRSTVVGYALDKGTEGVTGGFLPQRIAIVGEANTANQVALKTKLVFTSADEVAQEYGYGSPLHLAAKRLRGNNDVGGVGTVAYSVPEAGAAIAQEYTVTVTGTASKSASQTIIIAGQYIGFTVAKDDDATVILGKIKDAVNSVIDSPMTAGVVTATPDMPLTAKWAGESSSDIKVEFAGEDVGLTYAAAESAAGAGAVLPDDALTLFGSEWNTFVVNCLKATSTVLDAYEAFNGNSDTRNGRYNAEDWKPFVTCSGTVENDKDNLIAITTGRKNEQTNIIMPAPSSLSLPLEIAAATAFIYTPRVNRDPKLDIQNHRLIGIVPPQEITPSDLDVYNNRDLISKNGCSTVKISDGDFFVKDFITTYHKTGEEPPQFKYVRNLAGIDFNVGYRTIFLDNTYILGKTILPDSNPSVDDEVIKPDDAKSIIAQNLVEDFAAKGIFADAAYSLERLTVGINGTNPDRLDFRIPYQRSGFARIASTNAVANFYLGDS